MLRGAGAINNSNKRSSEEPPPLSAVGWTVLVYSALSGDAKGGQSVQMNTSVRLRHGNEAGASRRQSHCRCRHTDAGTPGT